MLKYQLFEARTIAIFVDVGSKLGDCISRRTQIEHQFTNFII